MLLDRATSGYSGSDLTSLAKDAALGPIRGKTPSSYYLMVRVYFSLHDELNQFLYSCENLLLHRVGTRPSPKYGC